MKIFQRRQKYYQIKNKNIKINNFEIYTISNILFLFYIIYMYKKIYKNIYLFFKKKIFIKVIEYKKDML